MVDDEVNEHAPPSSLGSPDNVNQRNDQGIELPEMNRRYPQGVRNTPDQFGVGPEDKASVVGHCLF